MKPSRPGTVAHLRRYPIPTAAHARQLAGSRSRSHMSFGDVRKSVPQGPDESSPVRSAGLTFLKSIRPPRDDRPTLKIAERHARPKAKRSYRPCGTDVSLFIISQHFVL